MRLRPHFRHFRNPSKTLCVQNPPGLFDSMSITPYYPKRFFFTSGVTLHCCAQTTNSYGVKFRRFLRILIPFPRSKASTRMYHVQKHAGFFVLIPFPRSKASTSILAGKRQTVDRCLNPFSQVKSFNRNSHHEHVSRRRSLNSFSQVKSFNKYMMMKTKLVEKVVLIPFPRSKASTD